MMPTTPRSVRLASSPPEKVSVRSHKMKTIIKIVVAVLGVASMTGCASTKAYFVDRGHDAADIFTLTMSAGLGARARVGPFHAGLITTVGDIGLRGGAIESDGGGPCNPFSGYELACVGSEYFWPQHVYFGDTLRCQQKTYYTDDPFVPLFTPSLKVYDPVTDSKISDSSFKHMIRNPYLTQVEVQASVVLGLRVGINIGELLDFVLGWATIDIYNDDIESNRQRDESNNTPDGIRR